MAKSDQKAAKQRAKRAQRRAAIVGDRADKAAPQVPETDAAPYGFALDAEGTKVAVDAEMEVVARIRELSEKRLHVDAIAAKLTAEGLDFRGQPWDSKRVSRILRRKFVRPPRKAGNSPRIGPG